MSNKMLTATSDNMLAQYTHNDNLSIAELLQDDRSRQESTLKKQLALPVNQADTQLIQQLIAALLKNFTDNEAGHSTNTISSLHSSWGVFNQWCITNGVNALPASAQDVSNFMQQVKSKVKLNTLSSYRWAINAFHIAAGLPSPTQPESIKTVFKGIRKEKARQSELVEQASAFRQQHLDALINLWRGHQNIVYRRNLAVMIIAYESMLRETELANIRFEHLTLLDDGRAELLVPVTKTNHSGEPDVVLLSRQCVAILHDYLHELARQKDYIFKPIKRNHSILYQSKPLTRLTIDRIFKQSYDAISQSQPMLCQHQKTWSGHSARVGACQDLLSSGFSILEVQQAGRWTSPMMVYRYGRNILAKESAMAKARWDRT